MKTPRPISGRRIVMKQNELLQQEPVSESFFSALELGLKSCAYNLKLGQKVRFRMFCSFLIGSVFRVKYHVMNYYIKYNSISQMTDLR